MTVLPIPQTPRYQERYLNVIPQSGLVLLSPPKRVLPPAGTDGVGLPPDKIMPFSGIYGANGKLPTVPTKGMTFLAYA